MAFFWFIARGYVVAVGLVYPALLMVNAIETNSAELLTKCVAHFVVMAVFSVAELVADFLLFWLPLIDVVKVIIVTALVAQDLSGSSWVYNVVVSPRLTQHARDIDEVVAQCKAYATLCASYLINVFASIVGMMTGSGAVPITPPPAVAAVASGIDLNKGAAGAVARPATPPLAGGGFVEVFQSAEQLRVRSAAQPPQLPPRLNTATPQARPLSALVNESMVAASSTPPVSPAPTSTLFSRLLAMVTPGSSLPASSPTAAPVPPTPTTPMTPKP